MLRNRLTSYLKTRVTLPTYLRKDTGIKVIKEFPDMEIDLSIHVADLDVAASYPSTGHFMNISKETTWRELCRIKDRSDGLQRQVSLNLTSPIVNATEICVTMLKMPTFDTLLADFM